MRMPLKPFRVLTPLKISSGGHFRPCGVSNSPTFSFQHTSSNTRSIDELETGMYLKIPQNNTTEEFQIIEIQNNQVVLANFDSTRYNLLQHMPDNEFVNSLKTIMARYFTIENKLYLDKIQFEEFLNQLA